MNFVEECKICSVHGLNIGERQNHWVVRDAEKEKKIPFYFYIESIIHVESYRELSAEAWEEFGRIIEKYTQYIYSKSQPLKIYTVSISEAVPHLHFHLVPRYIESPKGMEYLSLALSGNLGQ